mmetsp:Transcript_19155/g.32913  ORF Transcript_19155/g.32913 Transcript_19155/m.32913 type:complete len:286 (-) Transcript_19155:318-1175(-)
MSPTPEKESRKGLLPTPKPLGPLSNSSLVLKDDFNTHNVASTSVPPDSTSGSGRSLLGLPNLQFDSHNFSHCLKQKSGPGILELDKGIPTGSGSQNELPEHNPVKKSGGLLPTPKRAGLLQTPLLPMVNVGGSIPLPFASSSAVLGPFWPAGGVVDPFWTSHAPPDSSWNTFSGAQVAGDRFRSVQGAPYGMAVETGLLGSGGGAMLGGSVSGGASWPRRGRGDRDRDRDRPRDRDNDVREWDPSAAAFGLWRERDPPGPTRGAIAKRHARPQQRQQLRQSSPVS